MYLLLQENNKLLKYAQRKLKVTINSRLFYDLFMIQYKSMNQQQEGAQKFPAACLQNWLNNNDSQCIINEGQEQRKRQKQWMLKHMLERKKIQFSETIRFSNQEALLFYEMADRQASKKNTQTMPEYLQTTLKCAKDRFKYYNFDQEDMEIESQFREQDESLDKDITSKQDCEGQRQQFTKTCIEQSTKHEYPNFQEFFDVKEFLKSKRLSVSSLRKQLRDKIRNKLAYQYNVKRLKHECNCQEQECAQCMDLINFIYKEKLEQLSDIFSESKQSLTKKFLGQFYPIIKGQSQLQQRVIKQEPYSESEFQENMILKQEVQDNQKIE